MHKSQGTRLFISCCTIICSRKRSPPLPSAGGLPSLSILLSHLPMALIAFIMKLTVRRSASRGQMSNCLHTAYMRVPRLGDELGPSRQVMSFVQCCSRDLRIEGGDPA
jgi:hypothetical protein